MLEPNKQENRAPSRSRGISRGNRNIAWIEKHCVIPEGRDVGKPVRLRHWQRAELRKIYDNPAGTRRAIISFGRKNAKTTLSAFLLLLHLCGPEARRNSQLFSAAQSLDQAGVIFALAAKIVRQSPTLRVFVVIRDTAKQLACPELGTLYRALSAEKRTAFGLSPSFVVHDELGQVKGPRSELYEALETATGAQEEPLSVIISTQAPTDSDLLSVLIDDGLAGHDPRVVVSLYTAPIESDPFDRTTIELANPALGDFLNEAEVLAMAADAKRMPSRESEYRNLILNQRVEASDPFISRSLWAECGADAKPLNGIQVYGGLDLSEVNDLTALTLIGKVDGSWQVEPTFWLPADGLEDKARIDRVPYDVWARPDEKGRIYLNTAPGKSIDYDYMAQYLVEVFERYDIRKIAFDRWNFKQFRSCLLRAGFTEAKIEEKFIEFGQGYQSMSPALRTLEGEILNGRLAHGNHPVLAMCAANAVVDRDPAGNRKLTKAKSSGRIDGMIALAMAFGVAPMDEDTGALDRAILARGGLV
ncbi:MAG: terminase [Lysobacterales bacterium]|nr:MAG: terminase [Xanthomonadales bacterium]